MSKILLCVKAIMQQGSSRHDNNTLKIPRSKRRGMRTLNDLYKKDYQNLCGVDLSQGMIKRGLLMSLIGI